MNGFFRLPPVILFEACLQQGQVNHAAPRILSSGEARSYRPPTHVLFFRAALGDANRNVPQMDQAIGDTTPIYVVGSVYSNDHAESANDLLEEPSYARIGKNPRLQVRYILRYNHPVEAFKDASQPLNLEEVLYPTISIQNYSSEAIPA